MPRLSKIELSPDNGCVIDMKWTLGPLSYRASALGKVELEPTKDITRLPELVLYDHIGFKGSYARTNLSFHYVGDYWNDRMSCVIVVSGVWRFYRDDYYKGPHWDLGPAVGDHGHRRPPCERVVFFSSGTPSAAPTAAAFPERSAGFSGLVRVTDW